MAEEVRKFLIHASLSLIRQVRLAPSSSPGVDTRESMCSGGLSLRQRKSRTLPPITSRRWDGGSWTQAQGIPQETAAHPVSPDRVLIALERTEQGPCWGLLCGQSGCARLDTRHKLLSQPSSWPLGSRTKTSRPTLALTAPSQASPSPAGVAAESLHSPHQHGQGHAVTPGSPVVGLSLKHLCHFTESFPELLCSHSISSKLPSGACEDHEPAAASLSTPGRTGTGVGSPQMSRGLECGTTLLDLPPQPCLDNVYLAFKLSNFFHAACEPRKGRESRRRPLTC